MGRCSFVCFESWNCYLLNPALSTNYDACQYYLDTDDGKRIKIDNQTEPSELNCSQIQTDVIKSKSDYGDPVWVHIVEETPSLRYSLHMASLIETPRHEYPH
jgi:hypothetical protein